MDYIYSDNVLCEQVAITGNSATRLSMSFYCRITIECVLHYLYDTNSVPDLSIIKTITIYIPWLTCVGKVKSSRPSTTDVYVLYCFVLPNALRPFQIYCAPPNLDNTRTWICRLNFVQRPIFQAWSSWTSMKSQIRDPQLKVPTWNSE